MNKKIRNFFFVTAILDHFWAKMLKSETPSFHYFSQGFWISKTFGHPTPGSGGKKTFKRYPKSEHLDGHTDRRTHRRTFCLIESIGREGRCFENWGCSWLTHLLRTLFVEQLVNTEYGKIFLMWESVRLLITRGRITRGPAFNHHAPSFFHYFTHILD